MTDTLNGNKKILEAKSELDKALKRFATDYKNCSGERQCISAIIGDIKSDHTNILNTLNEVLKQEHEDHDFFRNSNLKLDYRATVENFVPISLMLINAINKVATKNGLREVKLKQQSYDTIQRFINTFSAAEIKEDIENQFKNEDISVTNEKFKKTMKGKLITLQLWLGIPLLLICGAAILFGVKLIDSTFNGIQLIFLKAFMALTISIVASSLIEGNATIKWTMQKGLAVRAVGWVAVFLLLYFLNPASPGDVH